jgi:hypothetical protein
VEAGGGSGGVPVDSPARDRGPHVHRAGGRCTRGGAARRWSRGCVLWRWPPSWGGTCHPLCTKHQLTQGWREGGVWCEQVWCVRRQRLTVFSSHVTDLAPCARPSDHTNSTPSLDSPGGCSGQRACSHAQLGISGTAHGPPLEYRQLLHGSSTHSHTEGEYGASRSGACAASASQRVGGDGGRRAAATLRGAHHPLGFGGRGAAGGGVRQPHARAVVPAQPRAVRTRRSGTGAWAVLSSVEDEGTS